MNSGIQFINGYKWVDTYYNGVKIAGSQLVEVSGEMLSVPNTYDDSAYIKIFGKTVEIGEGEKSPDNPYELKSVSDFDLVSAGRNLFDKANYTAVRGYIAFNIDSLVIGQTYTFSINTPIIHLKISNNKDGYNSVAKYDANGFTVFTFKMKKHENILGKQYLFIRLLGDSDFLQDIIEVNDFNIQLELGSTATPYTPFRGMQTVHIPYTLRGQGDVRDTVEYIGDNTWKYTQRLGVKVFDGTETLNASAGSSNEEYFGVYTLFESAAVATSNRQGYCSHGGVWTIGFLSWDSVGSGFIYNTNPNHFLRVPRTIANNVDEFRAFLIAEHAAGTPWTVEYELAEPIITYFTAPAPQTYYPYTQIYTTATVQPTLEAKIRVWEG